MGVGFALACLHAYVSWMCLLFFARIHLLSQLFMLFLFRKMPGVTINCLYCLQAPSKYKVSLRILTHMNMTHMAFPSSRQNCTLLSPLKSQSKLLLWACEALYFGDLKVKLHLLSWGWNSFTTRKKWLLCPVRGWTHVLFPLVCLK